MCTLIFGNLITYDFSVKQIDDDTKIQWGIVDFEIGDFCGWWPLWISQNGTDFLRTIDLAVFIINFSFLYKNRKTIYKNR